MKTSFAHFAMMIACLAMLFGCRSPRPVLDPGKIAERFVDPPQEQRYESAESPREVFEKSNGSGGAADPPRSILPTGGIGSSSNSRTGPYKF